MATVGARPAKQLNTMDRYECVLLIETDADAAAKILDDLTSAPEERFDVEWVTDLSGGIERLRSGAVGAVLLDLAPPDSHGLENFDKLHQAAPHVPILILADTGAGGTARRFRRSKCLPSCRRAAAGWAPGAGSPPALRRAWPARNPCRDRPY